jgi:hypothetical protein
MATRISSHRWFLRDIPRTYVVLVWLAFGLSLLFFFSDWSPVRREAAVQQQQNVNNANATNNARRYAGSIIVVPERGNRCLERGIDNRTGEMWDKGFVDCDEVARKLLGEKQRSSLSDERMYSIVKAFRPNSK